MDPIEQAFAAAVANARGEAKMLATAGFPQTASDQVAGALVVLWKDGKDAGCRATISRQSPTGGLSGTRIITRGPAR
jgi:hypothetical protein